MILTRGELFAIFTVSPGGNNSAVECNLAKVEVAGSNPVSRSILAVNHGDTKLRNRFPGFRVSVSPWFFLSGGVAKR